MSKKNFLLPILLASSSLFNSVYASENKKMIDSVNNQNVTPPHKFF